MPPPSAKLKEAASKSFASLNSSEAMQVAIRFTVQQLNMLLDQAKQLEKTMLEKLKKPGEELRYIG